MRTPMTLPKKLPRKLKKRLKKDIMFRIDYLIKKINYHRHQTLHFSDGTTTITIKMSDFGEEDLKMLLEMKKNMRNEKTP